MTLLAATKSKLNSQSCKRQGLTVNLSNEPNTHYIAELIKIISMFEKLTFVSDPL